MICECGHTNQWDNKWSLCPAHVQAGYVLPPERLAQLSPTPTWHEKAPREVQERKARGARSQVIEAIRAYDRERRREAARVG